MSDLGQNERPTATCDAEAAGYNGMFGVYCELPKGHAGPHNDGWVEWDYVDPKFRNQTVGADDDEHTPRGRSES